MVDMIYQAHHSGNWMMNKMSTGMVGTFIPRLALLQGAISREPECSKHARWWWWWWWSKCPKQGCNAYACR